MKHVMTPLLFSLLLAAGWAQAQTSSGSDVRESTDPARAAEIEQQARELGDTVSPVEQSAGESAAGADSSSGASTGGTSGGGMGTGEEMHGGMGTGDGMHGGMGTGDGMHGGMGDSEEMHGGTGTMPGHSEESSGSSTGGTDIQAPDAGTSPGEMSTPGAGGASDMERAPDASGTSGGGMEVPEASGGIETPSTPGTESDADTRSGGGVTPEVYGEPGAAGPSGSPDVNSGPEATTGVSGGGHLDSGPSSGEIRGTEQLELPQERRLESPTQPAQ